MAASSSAKRAAPAANAGRSNAKVRRTRGAATTEPLPELDLTPGLRDRILTELDASKVARRRRIRVLCEITGRTTSTVRRWLDPVKPGLPDLEAFTHLCHRFRGDSNYLLGLSEHRMPASAEQDATGSATAQWASDITRALLRHLEGCEPMLMQGNEMAPRINDGDILLVDRRINEIRGNGMYVLEYMGRTLVRFVEDRLGEGLVLSCANERYQQTVLPPRAVSGATPALKVLGKVMRSICVLGI